MKKVITIIIVILTNYSFLLSQVTFEKTFGNLAAEYGESGESVQQTSDNGYIITGYSQYQATFNRKALIIKTDEYGIINWKRYCDNSNYTVGYDVQETTDGGYIIVGYIEDPNSGNSDVYLIRLNNFGDTLWTEKIDNSIKDIGRSIKQTNDGGYIIAGYTCDSMYQDCDIYLIKTNELGDTIWTKTFGGPDSDQAYYIQQTSDSGYVILGSTFSFGNGYRDIYLIKTNEHGDTIFTKTYGGSSTDNAHSLKQTSDGGYIIVGETFSFNPSETHYDIYLLKTDEYGDTLWTKKYGGAKGEYSNSIDLIDDGGYIITGCSESYDRSTLDVFTIKTNNSGDTIWTQTFGGNGSDFGKSVQQTNDGGFIIVGSTSSFSNSYNDVYLIKLNGQGTLDINNNPISGALRIFPNPAKNTLNVKISEKTRIEIINLNGNVIYNKIVNLKNDLFSIDISGYPKGLYLVRFISEKNSTIEKVIIK